MRFFLSPFVFIFELIGFLISAAFVYGLVLIAVAALFIYTIENRPEPIVEYVHVIEETIETTPELTCTRLSISCANLAGQKNLVSKTFSNSFIK